MFNARRLFALALSLFAAAPAFAQGALRAEQLPPETGFYIHWRGVSSLDSARGVNSLLRLWADPQFQPARDALLSRIHSEAQKDGESIPLSREEFFSLLESPFIVGGLELKTATPAPAATSQTASANAKPKQPGNAFLIYDASGRLDLFTQILRRSLEAPEEQALVTTIPSGSATIQKVVTPKETAYQAFVGTLFLRAERREVLELLLKRLTSTEPPATSLAQLAEFQEARRQIGPDSSIEFFLRVKNLLPQNPAKPSDAAVANATKELRLDQLKSIAGSLSFVGESTRLRFLVLGDTAPGGLFDLLASGANKFATLAAAPSSAASYTSAQMDLAAAYATVRRVMASSLKPEQRGGIEMFEGMIAAQIGMPIPDALAIFTGEFASISLGDSGDPLGDIYVATIRDRDALLRVLRVALSTLTTAESHDGDTVFLSLALPYTDPGSTMQRKRFYHVAVTPSLLVVAPRKEIIRNTIARMTAAGSTADGTLAADPDFHRGRGRLPSSLSGLFFTSFARTDWTKFNESIGKAGSSAGVDADAAKNWISLVPPELFPRYLHYLAGGWWVGSSGLHYDGYIE